MSKPWVQSIYSDKGEKWEVLGDLTTDFKVRAKGRCDELNHHYLPKSEYRLCDPPEVWVDVTGECQVNQFGELVHIKKDGSRWTVQANDGYRLRKVRVADCSKHGIGEYKYQDVFTVEHNEAKP